MESLLSTIIKTSISHMPKKGKIERGGGGNNKDIRKRRRRSAFVEKFLAAKFCKQLNVFVTSKRLTS